MREMIDWIIGTDETVLDVAIDGLVAILGASFLTALRGKRLIKAWVRCWYEFEIYWFLMFSAG